MKVGGISLGPLGAFVKESEYAKDASISAHESYHNLEQANWGIVPWTIAYYGEMFTEWAYYQGDYWSGPYNNNSREEAARAYAGQTINPWTTQTPALPGQWDNFTQSAGSYMETIGNYYYDYYSNNGYW
jgi:hypothetical protein